MKEIMVVYRMLLGLIILFGLVCFYNIERVSVWLEKRLLEKFEINIVLTESKDLEKSVNIVEETIKKYDKIKFGQKNVVAKKDVWEMVSKKTELKHFSTLITKNPFPDIFKLKVSNFDFESLQLLLDESKTIKEVKEIIYDHNLFSYLHRLTLIKQYFLILKVLIILIGIFIMYI